MINYVFKLASGRAKCKLCRKMIPKGTKTMQLNLGTMRGYFCPCVYTAWGREVEETVFKSVEKKRYIRF